MADIDQLVLPDNNTYNFKDSYARTYMNAITEYLSNPTKTASGSTVTVTDGADNTPVRSLKFTLTPTQNGSGDPSPTNVREIVGYNDINIYNGYNFLTITDFEQGTISASTGATSSSTTRLRTSSYIPVTSGTYIFYVPSGYKISFRTYTITDSSGYISDESTNIWQSGTVTLTILSGLYIRIVMAYDDDTATISEFADTIYYGKNLINYTISVPNEINTFYGAVIDFPNNKLIITHVGVLLNGTETWIVVGSSASGNLRRYTSWSTLCSYLYNNQKSVSNVLCSHFTYLDGNSGTYGTFNTTQTNFFIKDGTNVFGTVDNMKTWLGDQYSAGTPVQIVGELSNPIVYDITGFTAYTYSGNTAVATNTDGTIKLTYYADPETRIAEILEE